MTLASRNKGASIEAEIAVLDDLPREKLVERWQRQYRAAPPSGISRQLMVRAIAWELQARRYGGLRPPVLRRLQKAIEGDAASDQTSATQAPSLRPGSRLLREWNGVTHAVEVTERGFVWKGETHRSLSSIARAITGARWSGPRFFGLNREKTS